MSSQESAKSTHIAANLIESHDTQVPHSSILYLIQEASKLVLPPQGQDQHIPFDGNPEQRQSPTECMSSYLFSGGKREGGMLKPNVLLDQGNSPLEVMHLINQQCERLLHPGLGDKGAGGFMTLSTHLCSEKFQHRNTSNVEGLICGEDPRSSSCPSQRANKISHDVFERRNGAVVEVETVEGVTGPTPDEAVKSTVEPEDPQQGNLSDHNYSFFVSTECRGASSCQEDRVELLCAEVMEEISSPLLSNWRPTVDSQVADKSPQSPSGKAGDEHEPSPQSPSGKAGDEHEPSPQSPSGKAGDEHEPSPISMMEAVPSLDADEGIEAGPEFSPDYNNNMELQDLSKTTPPTVHKQTGGEIAIATPKLSSPTGQAHSPHNQGGEEDCTVTRGDAEVPEAELSHSQRVRAPRKQACPSRSVDPHDPNLQGVMFRMTPQVDEDNQCRLLITSNYVYRHSSKELPNRGCKRRRLPKEVSSSEEEEEEEEGGDSNSSLSTATKTCASCCTRKTPLWRDAEDGTPLCNACGIRYKKYRVRCTGCWHIPRKDTKSKANCFKCGDVLRPSAQHKRGEW